METALVVGLLCIGASFGGLIVAAWFSDWTPPVRDADINDFAVRNVSAAQLGD